MAIKKTSPKNKVGTAAVASLDSNTAAPSKAAKTATVKGVHVKTRPGLKSFRRAGFGFNEQGSGIALSALSDEQLEALENETSLVVEPCSFEPGDDYISKA